MHLRSPQGHEAGVLTELGAQPRESCVPVVSSDGEDARVEHGDDGEHDEGEAAREGHVQAEPGRGARHAAEPKQGWSNAR